MKASILVSVSLLLFSISSIAGGNRTAEKIITQKEIIKYRYILKTEMLDAIVLNMAFGDHFILSETDKSILLKADVKMIDLVYTDFPKGENLTQLNLSRIKEIEALRKSLVSNELIKWRLIRQMDCSNEAEARTMFHGIVIHYKSEQTAEYIESELSKLNTFLPEESAIKDISKLRKSLPDSTVLKVLERKKDWDGISIVADMTGSMAPYYSQLVLWFKLKVNDSRINDLFFFNDGDMLPNEAKIIGKTGGIYHGKASNYRDIRELALKTVKNGSGGDNPENNIEAILYAINAAPETNEFVMVADNMASVKDIRLLDKVTKPIHIILCGTGFGVNPEYLTIAKKTGGSVHTIEKDLEDLMKRKEGEEFEFNGEKFRIYKGEVVKL